jgi:predicted nucleotidyltransferase
VTDFEGLLKALASERVDFILVGGAAAIAHGSPRLTQDLDVVYSRKADNLERLARALGDFKPYLRGAPPGLPFSWDRMTIARGLNFTLVTSLGEIDLLGEIPGGGSYEELVADSVHLEIFGRSVRCLSLEQLVRAKRAAGRPKDLEVLAELEAIRDSNNFT